uniref:Uncharacterized protein n=1 Tax=Romanomermis culicivorax TaxID=13658 RepID=A0A915K7Z4_ROMCU
ELPKLAILLFASGNAVITGAKEKEHIEDCLDMLIDKYDSDFIEMESSSRLDNEFRDIIEMLEKKESGKDIRTVKHESFCGGLKNFIILV